MNEFFKSIVEFCKLAAVGSLVFWLIPLFTLFSIWALSAVQLKVINREQRNKSLFLIHRSSIVSALVAATLLIGLTCFWWTSNYFSQHHLEISLLFSLVLALGIALISLIRLSSYFTQSRIKQIQPLPKTQSQAQLAYNMGKRSFNAAKYYFLLPTLGFLLLLLLLIVHNNLINIVFDNSSSMSTRNGISALAKTFDKLQDNNEIILTTVDGLNDDRSLEKPNMGEIMKATSTTSLKGGNVSFFNTPEEAKTGVNSIDTHPNVSPICESIWKSYLYLKENKGEKNYKNTVMVVITDGFDDITESLKTGKFFYDNEGFTDTFPADKVIIIDYSNGANTPFMQRFNDAGCYIYNAENSEAAYLEGLDRALESFKNNWNLIYWTLFIFLVFAITSIFIQPKMMV